MRDEESEEGFSMVDAVDVTILMQRDAHFSGSFPLMIEYYNAGGKGIHPEVELPRIEDLAKWEEASKENLAGMLLTGADAERVAEARKAYSQLREAAHAKKTTPAKLIADLILSEEEDPAEEIAAIVAQGPAIVPDLIHVMQAKDYYDPLFPGYGLAPVLVAHCLGKLGDRRAIATLFETIGTGDFFNEDTSCHALLEIGEPAKAFLLQILRGRPLTQDNERAALVLGYFEGDEEVAKACLEQLQDREVRKQEMLMTYLVLACGGLRNEEDRRAFRALGKEAAFASLQHDIEALAKAWV